MMEEKDSGFVLCHLIRKFYPDTPVMMLTARDTVQYRVAGLDRGADDYMIKPFEPKELLDKIKTLIKKYS